MLRIIHKNSYLKRSFSTFSQTLFQNEKFDLKTSNEEPSQSVSQKTKRIQIEPFIKNVFAGKYIYDYLKYPEYENNHELSIMNSVLVDPIKKLKSKQMSKEAYDLYNNLTLYSSSIPKMYGGLNLSQSTSTYISRLLEEYGANGSISYGINYIYNNELAAKSIAMYGSAQQKSNYLTKISNGELKTAFCYSEPDNGCDPARFQTRADEEKDGSFLINGKKGWVTLIPKIKKDDKGDVLFVVFCKIYDKLDKDVASLSAFLIEKNTEGVVMKKKFSDSQEFDIYEVEFNNVKANSSSLLGSLGAGFDIATKLIENSYHLVGALCVGILKTALRDTVDFCINTKRFGKSISEYTIVKERISDIDTRIYSMESMVYHCAGIIDSFEIADIGCESALTKIFCTESLKWGLDECLKIMATAAYSSEQDELKLKKNMNHANILANLLKTNDILRLHGKYTSIFLHSLIQFHFTLITFYIQLRIPYRSSNPKIWVFGLDLDGKPKTMKSRPKSKIRFFFGFLNSKFS
jgi:acyl-CoA dehydrogenase family member 9